MAYIGKTPTVGNFVKLDALTASSTASYTMQLDSVNFSPESVNHMLVSLNGVIQAPTDSYTISGSTITFASALTSSDSIDFIMVYGNVLDIGTPSDNTVSLAKLTATGTKDATTFLRGDNTFATVSGTTINNNADNRVITGSGTANTLEGEANLTYDGSTLTVKPSSNVHQLKLEQNNATDYWSLHADSGGGVLSFNRFTSGAETEKMRITSDGDMLMGSAVEQISSEVLNVTSTSDCAFFKTTSGGEEALTIWRQAANGTFISFLKTDGNSCGSINNASNGSVTTYATSSDYRLKENEVAISDGIERLKQLKPYTFNFIDNPENTLDGFFAHEVQDIVPEAVVGEKDGEEMQGIDQSKLVPLLTSALQEAITKIETLETRIEALENA